MVPRIDHESLGHWQQHLLSSSALTEYTRGSDSASTESIDAETMGRILSEAYRIGTYLRREVKHFESPGWAPVLRTMATHRPDESLSSVVAGIRRDPRLRFPERLATRLEQLIEMSREEQPEQAPPALASVQALIAFLAANPELSYPTMVLTPAGNVRVEWRQGRGRHFAIEFLGDVDVRFVVFAPDPKRPYKVARVSGQASLESVMTLVAPYGVRDWSAAKPA